MGDRGGLTHFPGILWGAFWFPSLNLPFSRAPCGGEQVFAPPLWGVGRQYGATNALGVPSAP